MSYKKHLVLSNGTDQINLMSAGAINDKFSSKITLYPYSASLQATSGLAPDEIVEFTGTISGEDFYIKAQADSLGTIAAGDS